ncbi:MAG: type II secretion system protein [Jatrophihabitans sp.]|uniref:type II secretion system protein n=1 Tax=Jatrophihabitans sp. TaxID=1932789 RepID=UPI003F7DCA5C
MLKTLERLQEARETRHNDKGFTLIELLIVIVILGILAGIVVFAVGGVTDKGDTSACKAEVTTIANAEEAYYAKTGGYGTITQLQTAPNKFLRAGTPKYVTAASATDGSLTMAAGAPCTAQ